MRAITTWMPCAAQIIHACMHANTTLGKRVAVWCLDLRSKHASCLFVYNSSEPRHSFTEFQWNQLMCCYFRHRWTTCADAHGSRFNDAECLFAYFLFFSFQNDLFTQVIYGRASCFLSSSFSSFQMFVYQNREFYWLFNGFNGSLCSISGIIN